MSQEKLFIIHSVDDLAGPVKYLLDSIGKKLELYTLIHIDAYRLEPHHKETLRVEDFLQDSGTLVCIEWPTAINLDNDLAYAHIDFEFMPKYTGNTELTEELYQERENMRRIKIRFKD